ncbi:UDP-3-O-[3-hydroxymyristoyl] glucosamine N-acyltransferase [Candidatus Rhodobacter oscarellae]|uniref:UDP-3-O-acylglucosamine N-acyltransferase n=1 Tax=Candidatus Rhodobacter oscarellae TaxID=1675527 RepID=A0A0J9GVX1_9RHOB|nr:UDP-3-O-(3-hydroxymyristoyl)glucosamine N-acyltransferase [Candidatus Rhodobacter lobularis]KMW57713.1 UDP-3-O-[3-hydroxymyristoyl] glucosamine N-acyltransferase [Candidatus Rhodobacter lobularis]
MQAFSVSEIGAALDAEVVGDTDLKITGAAEPADAGPSDLALAMDPKYADGLAKGAARVAALWEGADWQALGLQAAILVGRPRVGMAGLTALLDPGPYIAPGIDPRAAIDPSAEIGPGAAIGPFTVIGPGVRIGAGARIAHQVSVAEGSEIGADALLHPGCRIGRNVKIGDRFIGQPGATIGADGFSFVTPEKSRAEAARETLGEVEGVKAAQPWTRIHSLGSVIIGDDVEIGCNACVDAGTIRPTRIGNGCKIDNQVHVAHNCEVGKDCLFAGQVGIAGSVKIGNNVILGGQVGVVDNIFIGDGVVAGGGTVILSNAPAGRVLLGYPAVKMETHVETYKALRRLPRLAAQVAQLQKAVPKPGGND